MNMVRILFKEIHTLQEKEKTEEIKTRFTSISLIINFNNSSF